MGNWALEGQAMKLTKKADKEALAAAVAEAWEKVLRMMVEEIGREVD